MPNEIIATIDDAARLCGIDLDNCRGADLPPEQALVVSDWLQNELFSRPKNQVRPALNALPEWDKSYLAFILHGCPRKGFEAQSGHPYRLTLWHGGLPH